MPNVNKLVYLGGHGKRALRREVGERRQGRGDPGQSGGQRAV